MNAEKTMAAVRNIVLMKSEVTDVVSELDSHLRKTARDVKVS